MKNYLIPQLNIKELFYLTSEEKSNLIDDRFWIISRQYVSKRRKVELSILDYSKFTLLSREYGNSEEYLLSTCPFYYFRDLLIMGEKITED